MPLLDSVVRIEILRYAQNDKGWLRMTRVGFILLVEDPLQREIVSCFTKMRHLNLRCLIFI